MNVFFVNNVSFVQFREFFAKAYRTEVKQLNIKAGAVKKHYSLKKHVFNNVGLLLFWK